MKMGDGYSVHNVDTQSVITCNTMVSWDTKTIANTWLSWRTIWYITDKFMHSHFDATFGRNLQTKRHKYLYVHTLSIMFNVNKKNHTFYPCLECIMFKKTYVQLIKKPDLAENL